MTSTRRHPAALISRLRDATRHAHQQVEQHPVLAPLLRPGLDQSEYERVLKAFLSYYRFLEPRLEPQQVGNGSAQTERYRYLPRTGLLEADLRDLTTRPRTSPPYNDAPGPQASRTPGRLRSCTIDQPPAETLGWLYVLEGATQGGKIIGPSVARALNLSETFGARYFFLYKRGQWPLFQSHLERFQARYDSDQVIAGALAAFDNLTLHLDHSYSS